MHEYGVLIGRFQPFHNAHLELVNHALRNAQTLVIGIGSCNQARDTRNPWSGSERTEMILTSLSQNDRLRTRFVYLEDFPYNDARWNANVKETIESQTLGSSDVRLFGHKKNSTSFYLDTFPKWGPCVDPGPMGCISATKIRDLMFVRDKIGIRDMIPTPVYDLIDGWMETAEFERLHEEYHQILEHKIQWRGAPSIIMFNEINPVVVCNDHVLTIERQSAPGKGLFALPECNINQKKTLFDSCVHELTQEIAIGLTVCELADLFNGVNVFDHPQRDQRGRYISHAFLFYSEQRTIDLPSINGSNTRNIARWEPLSGINDKRHLFFSDHWHIIDSFSDHWAIID